MKISDGYAMADSRNLPKVDYMMLLQHMRENDTFNVAEIRGAKVMLSSRDSYVETSVGYVEVKRELSFCYVKGRVTPEHRVRTKMYTVLAVINEIEETITEVKCQDCTASQGGCKHAICFIMWLIKRTEEPSVTSVQCYWTQPKLSEAITYNRCIAAKEMGKRVAQSSVHLPNSLNLASFINECRKRKMVDSLLTNYTIPAKALDDMSIFKLILVYCNSLSQDDDIDFNQWKKFAETKLTIDIKKQIEENTRSQANCQLWHTLRQARITASKVYESTKCNIDGVLVKLILGGYKVPETKAIKRGKYLENEVIKEIEKVMNVTIRHCGLQLITPIVGASPDGLCEEQNFTVEIKCPSSHKTLENYIKDNNISPKCRAQIQLQMFAMGQTKALFCIADPNFENNKSFQQHWLYYDQLYVKRLLIEAEAFWEKYIFKKIVAIVRS